MKVKGVLSPDWYACQEKNTRDDKENLWWSRPQVPNGNKGLVKKRYLVKKAPLKTVKSSILYFSAQLEDDKSNAAQKRSNLQKKLEMMIGL